jgi:hypothetical protein
MRTSTMLGLTALMAALQLATAVSTATARTLSVSNQNIRATWTSLEFASGNLRCQVTLEGSFHSRTIVKVARTQIGAIDRAIVKEESCLFGVVRPRTETLPWPITYESFTGTLPSISSVLLLLSRLRVQLVIPGFCTGDYGQVIGNITGRANLTGGEITSLEMVEGRNTMTLVSGSFGCPAMKRLIGSGTVVLRGTTTKIRVTLI